MKTLLTAFFLLTSYATTFSNTALPLKENSEARDLAKFSAIISMGSFDVNIISDKTHKAVITSSAEALLSVETIVEDGVLIIRKKKGMNKDLGKVKVDVYTSELSSVQIKGSGNITCSHAFQTTSLTISIQGSGDVHMQVDADKVKTKIEGSGNVKLQGKCLKSDFTIEGSGNIDATELNSTDAEVSIAGSGDCKVNVSGNLGALIKGSGNILYTGGAKVKATSHGSGKIKPM